MGDGKEDEVVACGCGRQRMEENMRERLGVNSSRQRPRGAVGCGPVRLSVTATAAGIAAGSFASAGEVAQPTLHVLVVEGRAFRLCRFLAR